MALVLHEDDEEALEGEIAVIVHIQVALAVVHLGQYLVGEKFQLVQLTHLVHFVPPHFTLHHAVDDLFAVLEYLTQGHVDAYAAEGRFFLSDLLYADEKLQERGAGERKGDVFKVRNHLVQPGLLFATAHAHLLHDGLHHHLKDLVIALVEVLLLVVELIQHYLQVGP